MNQTRRIANVAMIAAIYTVVAMVLAPISFGPIQCRVSEALVLLPLIYTPSIVGVTLGCFLTNLLGALNGFNIIGLIDVVFGTMATLIAAYITYKYKNNKVKGIPVISMLAPIVVNGIIIGIELGFLLYPGDVIVGTLVSGVEVALSEVIAVILGYFVVKGLNKTEIFHE